MNSQQQFYLLMAQLRNDRLNAMGGYYKDYGWDEPEDCDRARRDNARTDQEVLEFLGDTPNDQNNISVLHTL